MDSFDAFLPFFTAEPRAAARVRWVRLPLVAAVLVVGAGGSSGSAATSRGGAAAAAAAAAAMGLFCTAPAPVTGGMIGNPGIPGNAGIAAFACVAPWNICCRRAPCACASCCGDTPCCAATGSIICCIRWIIAIAAAGSWCMVVISAWMICAWGGAPAAAA